MERSENPLPTLHFRGIPLALDSLVSIAHEELGATPRISLDEPVAKFVTRGLLAFAAGDKSSRLHLSLSGTTPPGTYQAAVAVGDRSFPVELHVEPYVHLALSPRQLVLSGHAGEILGVDLTLVNSGNVVCEIGKAYGFGLYDVHGAERGISAAFLHAASTREDRVERLLEGFAAGHGGLVRIQVEEGYGPSAPGDIRTLRFKVHLPGGLRAGQTYFGTLALENLRYYVKVRATEDKT